MAAIETTRTTAPIMSGTFSEFASRAFGAIAAWNDARVTRKSLSKLSARELQDIGLTYGDIEIVANSPRR